LPAAYVVLESLPLTPNGKLNRQALPEADGARPDSQMFVPPEGEIQERLAGIWSAVLNVETIGATDNFFELGGDSIHTIQVVARANQAGLDFAVRDMFECQTIAELNKAIRRKTPAATLQQRRTEDCRPSRFPSAHLLNGVGEDHLRNAIGSLDDVEDVLPLAPGADYMFARYLSEPAMGVPVIQSLSPVTDSRFDPIHLERAWQTLTERHSVLRSSFVWEQLPRPLQVVHKGVEFSFQYHDWRKLSAVEQEGKLLNYVRADRERSFDLRVPNPLRLSVIQLSDTRFQTLLTFNYLAFDGWALSIIYDQIADYFSASASGSSAAVTESVPYASYLEWISRQDVLKAKEFWIKEVGQTPAVSKLGDRAHELLAHSNATYLKRLAAHVFSADPQARVSNHYALLSKSASAALEAMARKHHLTMSSIASGAWAVVLSRITAATDVLFGIASSGRPAQLPHVETLVGRTLNPLPLRLAVQKEQPTATWLKHVQCKQVEIRQYEYVGLRSIHEWISASIDQPLFESYLVFQNLANLEFLVSRGWSSRRADVDRQRAFYIGDIHGLRLDVHPLEPVFVMMSYHTGVFDSATVAGLLDLYVATLEHAAEQPFGPVQDLLAIPLS